MSTAPSLADLGITEEQAAHYIEVAGIPKAIFEAVREEQLAEPDGEFSTAGFMASARRRMRGKSKMRGESKKTLVLRAAILKEFEDYSGLMSTRQTLYQLVSHGAVASTSQSNERTVGRLLVRMREDGSIPYARVTDRTRTRHQREGWDGVADLLESATTVYRRNLWANQKVIPIIACEKQALEGIFSAIVDEYGVSLFTIRGFNSESFDYEWSEYIKQITDPLGVRSGAARKAVVIHYFGDHDPAGLDIEANSLRKLRHKFHADFEWRRDGLLPEDLDRFDLIRLPVKRGYHGAKSFLNQFGENAAELDALGPAELEQRIRAAIEEHIDREAWETGRLAERREKESLNLVRKNWGAALAAAQGVSP